MAPAPRGQALRVELKGPFFVRDPRKTFRHNIRDLMDRIADVAERDVRARLHPGPSADAVRSKIRGRTKSLSGQRWAVTAVVSATDPSLTRAQQVKLNAQLSGRRVGTTRTGRYIGTTKGAKGRTAFRGTRSAVKRVVNDADMTKGM